MTCSQETFSFILICLMFSCRTQSINAIQCPTNCTCGPDESINKVPNISISPKVVCEKLQLHQMPNDFPDRVTSLSLSDNKLKDLSTINKLTELVNLNLAMNNIEKLDDDVFESNKNLQVLNLGYNDIKTISSRAFTSLKNLKDLNLEHNDLRKLEGDILRSLSNLETISLNQNDLRSLPDDIFEATPKLTNLNLSGNKLHTLPDTIFHDNPNLQVVDISNCEFNKVPNGALRGAVNLRELDISENYMRNLDYYSFTSLPNLEKLKINGVKVLKSIDSFTFSDLCKLRYLQITNNRFLTELDHNAFFNIIYNTSCFSLEDVDFHGNQLSTLMYHTLPICKIARVDLRDNQWRCDCLFRWVKSCRKDDKIHQQITCLEPLEFKNIEIGSIPEERFICPPNQDSLRREIRLFRLFTVSFGILVLIFVGMTIVFYLHKLRIMRKNNRYHRMGMIHYVKAPSEAPIHE